MRCAYHGWKFGLDGQCVEMPSEPAESSFASKVCHDGVPVRRARRGRSSPTWARRTPPPVPELEWTLLPESHVFTSKRVQDCNWFQAMEGGIDSSHISFLHAPIRHDDGAVTTGHGPRELRRGRGGGHRRPRAALRGASTPTTAC